MRRLGDNIALARKVDPGLNFRKAVEALIGSPVTMEPTKGGWIARKTSLIFPPEADRDRGREYLLLFWRIIPSVLDAADRVGAVRWSRLCGLFRQFLLFF
jgi:hypothetical protein